jgi:hypothetical protein
LNRGRIHNRRVIAMRKSKFVFLSIVLLCCVAWPAHGEEYYFRFTIQSREELSQLTKVISIDNVKDNVVFAYANDRELEEFKQLGYDYTLLPHPGTLIVPEMSSDRQKLREWDTYPTYDAYVAMMHQFETDYPDLCRIESIGLTVQGREILFAKISDNVDDEEYEPEVMYTSTMHGNETTGYILMLRLIDSLLSAYGIDPRITDMVNNMEIWINPLANPDGTYHGGNNTVSGAIRYNANGVDLNRNFPDPQDGQHPDGHSWQPETIAMMNIANLHSFIISANFHGGSEVVNYPWDTWQRRHADDTWYQDICHEYADSAHAHSPSTYMDGFDDGITNGWDWYEVNGGRQDYMNYWQGCREVTIELSNTMLLPGSQLPAHWIYNRVSFLDYLENARYGIKGIVTDSTTGLPVAATISVLNHDMDRTEIYADPDIGDYHRMIEAGIYDLRFTASGYLPKTVEGVVITEGSVTTVDVQMQTLPDEPYLEFVGHDAGAVDPGDTVLTSVTLINNGGREATGVSGTLSTDDTNITVTQDVAFYPSIPSLGGTGTSIVPYKFVVSPSCPLEYMVDFSLYITVDGGYNDTLTFSLIIGRQIEDFETGDFSAFAWQMSGNKPWTVNSSVVYEGDYGAKSGSITSNQITTMSVTLQDLLAGEISFYYKVSSEPGYDLLRFYIDGIQKGQWSGEIGWFKATYLVSAGTHTFRWSYSKDGSTNQGSDCGWVDFIVFPPTSQDPDNDGIPNSTDNCPTVFNPDQEDNDLDGIGDSCDICISVYNPAQEDLDMDGAGDSCDNCIFIANPGQEDVDADGVGDSCDICISVYNPAQEDLDMDGAGDSCDNCIFIANPGQEDLDADGVGDSCDNCLVMVNPFQEDVDADGVGDSCDNCLDVYNPLQEDSDSDGIGDSCDYICGDVNGDEHGPNVADVTYLVDYLFREGPAPPNMEAADIDGSGGDPNVADVTYLVDFLFRNGPAPLCGQL